MNKTTIRTRMAPSPTGEFHIGGMRTLLYNYALAKKEGGKFVLRIEDTDQSREVEGATQRIMDVIKDYGFNWDEGPDVGGGYGPYVQSERVELYKEHAQTLIENKRAYYCFCSAERLTTLREAQQKNKMPPRYDKKCLSLSEHEVQEKLNNNEPYVIRLNVEPNKDITWNDLILDEITINSSEIDDQVLLKSDGFPTYHLAVVVDDYLMKISHVMRGKEWLPSTPKQILLYRAFGWDAPKFGHLPNLKEKGSNSKMSKRYGDVHARAFLEKGYLVEALNNFMMFLGWNPGTDNEIYSLNEFIADFSIERIHKTDMVAFDRDKLLWLNGHYIRSFSVNGLMGRLLEWGEKYGIELLQEKSDLKYTERVVGLIQERLKTLDEFKGLTYYFYNTPDISSVDVSKFGKDKTSTILEMFIKLYNDIDEKSWKEKNLEDISRGLISDKFKPKECFMTLRIAVTGETATPPLFDTLELIGKKEVLVRLESALKAVAL